MAQQIKFGDKLILKGETLILDNGTSHGELKSNNGTVWIKGDLLVDGSTTTINTETINLADNNILINSDHSGAPTHDGSITINRGTSDNAVIQWTESTDKWEAKVGAVYATFKADTFEGNVTGNLTGNSTGTHFGGVDTQGGDILASGTNDFASILLWGGTINDTIIGDATPTTGAFTTISGALTGPVTGTVSSIANHSTSDLSEGTNLYYTESRVDARYAILHSSANADTLDNQDGTYYLDYNNFTNTPVFNTDFDTRLSTKSTTDLAEGTNLYYTDARAQAASLVSSVNGLVGTVVLDSSHLPESVNLYYTDARADARAQLKIDALVGGASAAFDTLLEIETAMATDTELTNAISALNHDSLSGFVANEHIDWTAASAGTIDSSNYTNSNTTYTAGTDIAISGTNVISNTFTLPYNIVYDNSHQALHHTDAISIDLNNVITLTKGDSSTETITVNPTDITGDIIPAGNNTYDLGSSANRYKQIYGYTVEATFADLAERYATDVPYESGTVVVFGGEAEITTTTEAKDVSVAGVISTNPALKLNADAGNSQTHPYVALKGRVPCMLIGPVSKGDLIVTADNEPGFAQSIGKNDAGHSVFAKSIETDLTEGKKVIEVVIL